jgi:hypothetical protein
MNPAKWYRKLPSHKAKAVRWILQVVFWGIGLQTIAIVAFAFFADKNVRNTICDFVNSAGVFLFVVAIVAAVVIDYFVEPKVELPPESQTTGVLYVFAPFVIIAVSIVLFLAITNGHRHTPVAFLLQLIFFISGLQYCYYAKALIYQALGTRDVTNIST